MKKVMIVGALLAMAAGVAVAGTPPAIQKVLDKCEYYTFDAQSKQWLLADRNSADINDPPADDSCEAMLEQAAKDGVSDTLTVNVPWDSPEWKRGPHTVAELKTYCKRARHDAQINSIIMSIEWGSRDAGSGDMAAKCIELYNTSMAKWKLPPTIKIPYMGKGTNIVDPATGDPFTGTLEEGRKKFCDAKAKDYLAEKEKEEGPYRKVLKGAKLDVALAHLNIYFDGPGKKTLKTPAALAKANHWYRLKRYDERSCANGAKVIYALERYYFNAKNELTLEDQVETCGAPARSAYK